MAEKIDLNSFIAWANAKPRRTVSIKINDIEKGIDIFAYDYDMRVGQSVQSVEEIDLEARKFTEEKAEFERLKAKFEPELKAVG